MKLRESILTASRKLQSIAVAIPPLINLPGLWQSLKKIFDRNLASPLRVAYSKLRISTRQIVGKRKVSLLAAGIAAVFVAALLIYFYAWSNKPSKVYYIAFIGRYDRPGFDNFHVRALHKYLAELNAELGDVRLELEVFQNKDSEEESERIYKEIAQDGKFLAVIDNTWGVHLRPQGDFIGAHGIPVISLNADKQNQDFKGCALFLGYEDGIPKKVVDFSTRVLSNDEVIFITEKDYPLTASFEAEFKGGGRPVTSVLPLKVTSGKPNDIEEKKLFEDLKAELENWEQRQKGQPKGQGRPPTIILNTHNKWGNKIIRQVEKEHSGVTILGGPYIIDWTAWERDDPDHPRFGMNEKKNRLIIFTYPHDVVTRQVRKDSKELYHPNQPKNPLFVKRCRDAVSLIRGALVDDSKNSQLSNPLKEKFRSTITRKDVIQFFRNKLAAKQYASKDDVYEFTSDLLLTDERSFEEYFEGKVFSYEKQLDAHGNPIPNVHFGFDNLSLKAIDTKNRSFHADFLYWLSSEKAEKKGLEGNIQFLNRIDELKEQRFSFPENPEVVRPTRVPATDKERPRLSTISGNFSMDVDFRNYPFDTQEIRIALAVIYPPDEKQRISFDHVSFARESLDEWRLEESFVTYDNLIGNWPSGPSLEEKRPQKVQILNVWMRVARRLEGPIVTIILPLFLIGFAAVALLSVKDNSFASEGQICAGLLLSIVTYSIAFAQMTPRADVFTIADKLFYVTFVTVLLVFLKVVLFNSSLLRASFKGWVDRRSTIVGVAALIGYCLMVGGILLPVFPGLEFTVDLVLRTILQT